jgi:hypothetical protein
MQDSFLILRQWNYIFFVVSVAIFEVSGDIFVVESVFIVEVAVDTESVEELLLFSELPHDAKANIPATKSRDNNFFILFILG